MSAADLRRVLERLPGEALLPVAFILETLAEGDDGAVDLTLPQVAERTGKAVSTVRGWVASGLVRGYKLHGKEWRVPADALAEFFERARADHAAGRAGEVGLGAWRRLREPE